MKKYFHIIVLIILTFACDTPDVTTEPEFLVDAQLIGTTTKEEFATELENTIGGSFALFASSGFEKIRITYNTVQTDGTPIIASAALLVPTNIAGEMLFMSYQHGTLINEADAPSYFKEESEAAIGSFFASTGVIVALPDYIGYGESKNAPHPYEHKKGSAQPVVDMILAVKEYFKQNDIQTRDEMVLGGYSQGAYVSMATLQLIEQSYSQLNVSTTFAGAGAYDKTSTFMKFLENGTIGDTTHNRSYIWVLLTYIREHNLNDDLSYYLREPYLSQVLENGYLAEIEASFDQVITEEFKNDVLAGTNQEFLDALAENDLVDWSPRSTVKLYHGTEDNYVPFLNSENALAGFNRNGAQDVSLTPIEGGNHGSSISTFFLETFSGLNQLRSTQAVVL